MAKNPDYKKELGRSVRQFMRLTERDECNYLTDALSIFREVTSSADPLADPDQIVTFRMRKGSWLIAACMANIGLMTNNLYATAIEERENNGLSTGADDDDSDDEG